MGSLNEETVTPIFSFGQKSKTPARVILSGVFIIRPIRLEPEQMQKELADSSKEAEG